MPAQCRNEFSDQSNIGLVDFFRIAGCSVHRSQMNDGIAIVHPLLKAIIVIEILIGEGEDTVLFLQLQSQSHI